MTLKTLLTSTSLQSAFIFGVGGIGFSLAMLFLARYLAVEQFGLLALLLALIQIGLALGPAGIDLLINREQLLPAAATARAVAMTSALAATLIAAVAGLLYKVPLGLLPALGFAIFAAAQSKVAAAFFQSAQQFKASLALTQVHNFVLLAIVPLAIVRPASALSETLAVISFAYAVTAAAGWLIAARRFGDADPPKLLAWHEGLHGMGIIFAVLVLAQTERILIPLALSLEEMARFGVLAAVVVAPFRMLQLAVGYTLLPRLRKAASIADAKRILRGEVVIAMQVGLIGAIVVYAVGPVVIALIVGDKYHLSGALFLAAIGVGWIRLAQSISVATVNSLGDAKALRILNSVAWLSLAVAVVSAWSLRGSGLLGIILGVGCGWLLQAVAGYLLADRTISDRFLQTS